MSTLAPTETRPRLLPATIPVAAILVATIIVSMLCLHKAFADHHTTATLSLWAVGVVVVQGLGAGALFFLSRHQQRAPRLRSPRRGLGVLIAVGLSAASLVGAWTLSSVPVLGPAIAAATTLTAASPLAIMLLALVAGASEETFFRLGLRRVLPPRSYVLLSTALYAITTVATGNPSLIVMSVVLGLTCAISLQLTRWWLAPILIHGLWTVTMVGVFPQFN